MHKFGKGSSTLALVRFSRRMVEELVKQGAMKPSYWWSSAVRRSLCKWMTFSLFSSSSLHLSMVPEVATARNISPIMREGLTHTRLIPQDNHPAHPLPHQPALVTQQPHPPGIKSIYSTSLSACASSSPSRQISQKLWYTNHSLK